MTVGQSAGTIANDAFQANRRLQIEAPGTRAISAVSAHRPAPSHDERRLHLSPLTPAILYTARSRLQRLSPAILRPERLPRASPALAVTASANPPGPATGATTNRDAGRLHYPTGPTHRAQPWTIARRQDGTSCFALRRLCRVFLLRRLDVLAASPLLLRQPIFTARSKSLVGCSASSRRRSCSCRAYWA